MKQLTGYTHAIGLAFWHSTQIYTSHNAALTDGNSIISHGIFVRQCI